MLVEKVQVQAMAERAVEMLQGHKLGAEEEPADLQEPVEPDWRAGQMGLGMDEDRTCRGAGRAGGPRERGG